MFAFSSNTRFRVKGLETAGPLWEFYTVNAVKVDSARRIRPAVLKPGDYYEPQIQGAGAAEIILRRIPPPRRQWTEEESLKAINKSPLRFTRNWEALKEETR